MLNAVLTSRLNKINMNEHLVGGVVAEWWGKGRMCSAGVDYPAITGHV